MHSDDVELIVLTILAENATSDTQRQALAHKIELLRSAEMNRFRDRQLFLLRLLLYVAFGILILIALHPLARGPASTPAKAVPGLEIRSLDGSRSEGPLDRRALS